MGDFSHLNKTGQSAMVDVSGKTPTMRSATVRGLVRVSPNCAAKVTPDVALEIARAARIAGVMAAKKTSDLIPLCHQVPLSGVDLTIEFDAGERVFAIAAETRTESVTGVEMEAFCAASVAGVTVYDMIKAVDPAATVGPFSLTEKLGGKSGRWTPSND